jgi:hypothetical protein
MATGYLYNSFKSNAFSPLVDFANDTLKVALLEDSYTPSIDNDEYFDDISANELAIGGGYTAGGKTVGGKSVTVDTGTNKSVFDCGDPEWTADGTGFTCRYAVLYKSTGTPANDVLIAYWDFGGNQNSISIAFTLVVNILGLIDAA